MSEKSDLIRDYWGDQAERHGIDLLATVPDRQAKELEIRALLEHVPDRGRVLDVGCGNGYTAIELAKVRGCELTGVDYSPEMVQAALNARRDLPADIRDRVRFGEGDVLSLPFDSGEFDVVLTDRCLINLTTLEAQRDALREIHRVLKPGGLYLMCENTIEGLASINELRTVLDLPGIQMRWHNLYLSEEGLSGTLNDLFEIEAVDPFCSLYYVVSRVIYAKLAEMTGEEVRYDHPLNQITARLPSMGDRSPLKLFRLRKAGDD